MQPDLSTSPLCSLPGNPGSNSSGRDKLKSSMSVASSTCCIICWLQRPPTSIIGTSASSASLAAKGAKYASPRPARTPSKLVPLPLISIESSPPSASSLQSASASSSSKTPGMKSLPFALALTCSPALLHGCHARSRIRCAPCSLWSRRTRPCDGSRPDSRSGRGRRSVPRAPARRRSRQHRHARPPRQTSARHAESPRLSCRRAPPVCHPSHPWERGTNENTNGPLWDWFPKGESLDDVSDSEVRVIGQNVCPRQSQSLRHGVER